MVRYRDYSSLDPQSWEAGFLRHPPGRPFSPDFGAPRDSGTSGVRSFFLPEPRGASDSGWRGEVLSSAEQPVTEDASGWDRGRAWRNTLGKGGR